MLRETQTINKKFPVEDLFCNSEFGKIWDFGKVVELAIARIDNSGLPAEPPPLDIAQLGTPGGLLIPSLRDDENDLAVEIPIIDAIDFELDGPQEEVIPVITPLLDEPSPVPVQVRGLLSPGPENREVSVSIPRIDDWNSYWDDGGQVPSFIAGLLGPYVGQELEPVQRPQKIPRLLPLPEPKTVSVQRVEGAFAPVARNVQPTPVGRIDVARPFVGPRYISARVFKKLAGLPKGTLLRRNGTWWDVVENSETIDLEDSSQIYQLGNLVVGS